MSDVDCKESHVDFKQLIVASETGDPQARATLFSALYQELHGLAQRQLRRQGGLSLSPTTLLHEAYLNISSRGPAAFPDRAQFLSYACRAMRNLLIDYVRRRSAHKRGGQFEITLLPTELPAGEAPDVNLERIGEAVESLASIDAHLARVVDLKFFCGMSHSEIAALLDRSERTVGRDWDKARMLLQDLMSDS
jgi:RNA polymerase sigma factor (TIGR02999 family)